MKWAFSEIEKLIYTSHTLIFSTVEWLGKKKNRVFLNHIALSCKRYWFGDKSKNQTSLQETRSSEYLVVDGKCFPKRSFGFPNAPLQKLLFANSQLRREHASTLAGMGSHRTPSSFIRREVAATSAQHGGFKKPTSSLTSTQPVSI